MEAGTTIGPYELVDTHKIGDGAGCVGVYKAVDTRSGQLVAIKTVDRVREGMQCGWPVNVSAGTAGN